MKLVVAYINQFKLEQARDALKAAGVGELTVTHTQGFGQQGGHTETYRGAEYEVEFVPKVRLEILADDGLAPTVVSAIAKAARSGRTGDGKIAVLPVEDVMRIRTGERGAAAL